MAIWWITEAVPLAVTALLPAILFPFLHIMKAEEVAPVYFNKIIMLFLGGFMIALAMERWQLHKRIALNMISRIGTGFRKILLGFMIATAFLSMWISNTATTMMMVPIAVAMIIKLEEHPERNSNHKFSTVLLLGIAYSASIGGLATLIGTPPNLILVRMLKIHFPAIPEISFGQWLIFAFPLSVLFLLIAWAILVLIYLRKYNTQIVSNDLFEIELHKLKKITYEEKVVLVDFILLAILLVSRKSIHLGAFIIPGWSDWLPAGSFVDDGTVALGLALLLFFIPTRKNFEQKILDWQTARKLPWNILLLFGGGFALAAGFKTSGLSLWIGLHLKSLETVHPFIILLVICFTLTFLTELTSNTATTNIILPVLASLSVVLQVNPLLIMIPATLSASCAFMLPVATPPNAIIFGSQRIRVQDMAKTGVILNFVGIFLISTIVYFLSGLFFPGALP